MADRYYTPGGITVGTNFQIGAEAPIDARFTVASKQGLDDAEFKKYEGLISYVKDEKTYYQFVDGAWKALSVNSAAELEETIKSLIATETTGAMEFKGATAALPENPAKGDMWKVAGENISIVIDEKAAKVGDTIIYNGEAWTLIPSGDDIEDTWRKVIAGGSELANDETLELIAGENVTITEDGGKVTISSSYEDTHYESKLVVGNETTDSADENVVENGNVRLNLVEDGVVKSSHKIVGAGGITVTHATGDEGNVITIEAAEGAKYDLTAKTENNEAVLSLTGTDNTEDKVAVIGDDAVSVSAADGKIKVSAHDTKYTGSEGNGIKVTVVDDGAISAEIEANAVTTDKIADKNVTLAKLADEVINTINKDDNTEYGFAVKADSDLTFTVTPSEGETYDVTLEANAYAKKAEGNDTKDTASIAGAKLYADAKITEEIGKLDATKVATTGKYINKIVQVDGVITEIGEADLPTDFGVTSVELLPGATNGSLKLKVNEVEGVDVAVTGLEEIKVKNATHADAAAKVDAALTVKVSGADVVFDGSEAKTADVDSAIAAAIAKIPEVVHPEYSIIKDTTSDYAATYRLTKDGVIVDAAAAINIPKDMVVQSGEVRELEAGTWGEKGTYIVITLANATDDKLYINVGELIEYVTGGTTADIEVSVDPTTHIATATLTQAVKDNIALGVTALQSVTVLGKELTKTANEITTDEAKTALGLGGAAYKAEDYYFPTLAPENGLEASWNNTGSDNSYGLRIATIGHSGSECTVVTPQGVAVHNGSDESVTTYRAGGINVSSANVDYTLTLPTEGGTLTTSEEANKTYVSQAETGLKIVTKEDETKSIAIDEEVIFVLDCNW